MKRFRERKSWIVLIAVLLLLAACKGETPTAPPPGGGGTPGGGTTPPTGVTLTLATTNSSPLVDSSVIITATAKLNDALVPNGTAVEFVSTSGSLNGSGTAILRTTTNGISTVTLTATTTGLVRVSATVNNVTRSIDITFVARPVVDPPITTTPTISSITPSIGRPAGGQVIRIVGTNFKSPVRVLFDTGGPLPVEGSVQSVSDTVIEVITPPVNLGSGQELAVDVIVLTQAGSTTEQRVELADGFTYRNEQLTPIIHTVTPNSGPVTGGTRVTILGEGFQEPVQVLFNTAEARILNITYGQILVETPAARDTDPNGSGAVTGPVTVLVRNINSNTTGSMAGGFLYKAAMQITGVTVSGSTSTAGGARVTIEGIGFLSPLIVVVRTPSGDIGLSQVSVTGTKIVAITPTIIPESCDEDLKGPIVVTNINNGDQAEGPIFTFTVIEPAIINVSPSTVTIGVNTSFTVTVVNPLPGFPRFIVNARTVFPTVTTVNGDGSVTFTLPVPTRVTFPTEDCGLGGTRQLPADIDVEYVPGPAGCEDKLEGGLTVNPADGSCVLPPAAPIASVNPAGTPGSCALLAPDPVVAAGAAVATTNITFTNAVGAGGSSLTISGATVSGTNGTFGINQTGAGPLAPGANATFTVTVDPTAIGPITGTATFSTNDPNRPTVTVCITGSAN